MIYIFGALFLINVAFYLWEGFKLNLIAAGLALSAVAVIVAINYT